LLHSAALSYDLIRGKIIIYHGTNYMGMCNVCTALYKKI
jgi:hypothetical protein